MAKRLSEQEISVLANCDSSDESGDDFSSTDEDELYVQPDTSAHSLFSEREHAESSSNAEATQQAITLLSNNIQSSSSLDSSGAPDTFNSELQPSSEENVPLVGEHESNEWIDTPWEISDFPFLGPEPGAKIATNKSTAPSMYADLFFNDEFLENLVTETNRYATQVLSTRRLRRSSKLKEWRETNKAEMKSDQKRLYKSLERPEVCGAGPGPDQANTVAFWRGLWSEPVNHSEGPWTEVVVSQCASITPMDPVIITPDDVAEAVRRAPNWKSPGLDGLHHYWLKGFMVCHAVLARQFQEALNQKSLPSLFTSGITHLVPKDQALLFNKMVLKFKLKHVMTASNRSNGSLKRL
ncbi:unnamed protein product [Parnassius apollo]|uniref:(apollo) hypothetical protein n=1 Tax=Parnassius apollo TaxID=110799 RepID=A0A8S3Y087_PARAO|nr:unnamed protein product [Parnassius apollo]